MKQYLYFDLLCEFKIFINPFEPGAEHLNYSTPSV
jgi:hypothetical protein